MDQYSFSMYNITVQGRAEYSGTRIVKLDSSDFRKIWKISSKQMSDRLNDWVRLTFFKKFGYNDTSCFCYCNICIHVGYNRPNWVLTTGIFGNYSQNGWNFHFQRGNCRWPWLMYTKCTLHTKFWLPSIHLYNLISVLYFSFSIAPRLLYLVSTINHFHDL